MQVQKMDAEKYQVYVTKEFEKLVQCKLGKMATERNKRIGKAPTYTTDQRESILRAREPVIRLEIVERFKKMLEEVDLVNCHHDYLSQYIDGDEIDNFYNEAVKGLFAHPDFALWEEHSARINEEFIVRETAMEKTVDNMVRNFCTGLTPPQSLNNKLDEIEKTEF